MDERLILRKFGNRYIADDTTYKMGVDMRLARHLAARFKGRTVLETCTGGGFTAIPISKYAEHIYTFETDGARMEAARENAVLSRADRKITFINHDVTAYDLASLPETIDAAFIDPDWADEGSEHAYRFIGSTTRPPSDALLERVFTVTPNVTLVQPPMIDPPSSRACRRMSWNGCIWATPSSCSACTSGSWQTRSERQNTGRGKKGRRKASLKTAD
jgi:hypothetical protein